MKLHDDLATEESNKSSLESSDDHSSAASDNQASSASLESSASSSNPDDKGYVLRMSFLILCAVLAILISFTSIRVEQGSARQERPQIAHEDIAAQTSARPFVQLQVTKA